MAVTIFRCSSPSVSGISNSLSRDYDHYLITSVQYIFLIFPLNYLCSLFRHLMNRRNVSEGEEKLGEEEHTYDGSDEDQTILYNSTVSRSPPPHQRVRLCMKRAERTTVDPSSKSMVKDLTFPSSPGWSSVTLPNLSHFLLSLSLTTTLSPKLKASLLPRTFLRALFW